MTPHSERDRTTLRRAFAAGGIVWAVAFAALALNGLAGGLSATVLPVQVALAAPFGAIVACLWIWLANLLDVMAGEPPSRRRWLWAAGLTLTAAFVLPLVLRASLGGTG